MDDYGEEMEGLSKEMDALSRRDERGRGQGEQRDDRARRASDQERPVAQSGAVTGAVAGGSPLLGSQGHTPAWPGTASLDTARSLEYS